jgi:hypothetical protein
MNPMQVEPPTTAVPPQRGTLDPFLVPRKRPAPGPARGTPAKTPRATATSPPAPAPKRTPKRKHPGFQRPKHIKYRTQLFVELFKAYLTTIGLDLVRTPISGAAVHLRRGEHNPGRDPGRGRARVAPHLFGPFIYNHYCVTVQLGQPGASRASPTSVTCGQR